jgi:hypothetical protein
MGRTCSMHGSYNTLSRKDKGNSPLKKTYMLIEDNIKINLTETGKNNEEWIHLAKDKY